VHQPALPNPTPPFSHQQHPVASQQGRSSTWRGRSVALISHNKLAACLLSHWLLAPLLACCPAQPPLMARGAASLPAHPAVLPPLHTHPTPPPLLAGCPGGWAGGCFLVCGATGGSSCARRLPLPPHGQAPHCLHSLVPLPPPAGRPASKPVSQAGSSPRRQARPAAAHSDRVRGRDGSTQPPQGPQRPSLQLAGYFSWVFKLCCCHSLFFHGSHASSSLAGQVGGAVGAA